MFFKLWNIFYIEDITVIYDILRKILVKQEPEKLAVGNDCFINLVVDILLGTFLQLFTTVLTTFQYSKNRELVDYLRDSRGDIKRRVILGYPLKLKDTNILFEVS